MSRDGGETGASTASPLLIWLALPVGFSPAIVEYLRGFGGVNAYSPATTLLAPLLLAAAAWRERGVARMPRRSGAAWVAAGLLLQLSGIALELWTITWVGFPIAIVGVALWSGRPSWPVAALSFGLVPVPVSVETMGTPAPETALLGGLCALWREAGAALACNGPVARSGDLWLELVPGDVGWTQAWVLAQLGWFAALCTGATAWRATRTAALCAAATPVLQPAAVAIALGALLLGFEEGARTWLTHGVWLTAALATSGWLLLRRA